MLHPRIYIARSAIGYIIVRFYVDDFKALCTDQALKIAFKKLMTDRYGPDMVFADPSSGVCGLELIRHPNHSVTVHVGKYVTKHLHQAGMDKVPPALSPSLPGLFIIAKDSPLLSLHEADQFRTVNGWLVWMIAIRFDIAKEVRFLCSRTQYPTVGDRLKQIQLLRYLKGVPNIGPTYTGQSSDPPGMVIVGMSDAGHAVHPSSGASQIAYQLSLGYHNAPFLTHCSSEKGVISDSSTAAEYIGLNQVSKASLEWRHFLEWLGFDQSKPSPMLQDNNSAINLTKAPFVTRHSRYVALRHHYVRSLFRDKQIVPVYTNTNDMGPVDMHTKSSGPPNINKFLYDRSLLFNDAALPNL
jgi:hypothetical protein